MVVLRFLLFIVIGVVFGILFNKFVIRHFSDNLKKIFSILTMFIFILSSISMAITFNIKSGIISSVNNYSERVEKYIIDNNPNNDFLLNGINLSIINNNSSIVNNTANELKTLIPTHTDLRMNKRIYDMVIGYPMDELMNQINNLNNSVTTSVNSLTASLSIYADSNNFITISSILNYLKSLANRHINIVFIRINILLLIPFFIYIISISVFMIIKIVKK